MMQRPALFGLLTGLMIAAWMNLEYLLGLHTHPMGRYTGLLSVLFSLLGIWFGIRAYRRQLEPTGMTYWEGVLAGAMVSVVAGLVTAVSTFFYHAYVNPEFVDFMVKLNRQALEAHQATPVQIKTNAVVTREFYQPWPQATRAFGGYVAVGSLFSLILAGLLKTRRLEA